MVAVATNTVNAANTAAAKAINVATMTNATATTNSVVAMNVAATIFGGSDLWRR